MSRDNRKYIIQTYRRKFLKCISIAILIVVLGFVIGCQSSLSERLPNIVIIFTDDQGYSDLGCYGAQGFTTPNIDRMAAEGMRFTDFYVASSVCTPSRAALLTGCYPQRIGLPNVLAPPGPAWTEGRTDIGLNSEELTIAEMLKPLGYATACFGKWHLGHKPQFSPIRHGFDEYFGLPYSNDMRPQDNIAFPALPLMEGEKIIQYDPEQSQLTTWFTERSIQFMEKNKDRPFFLYVPHSMPHIPLYVSDKFRGKSEQGLYGDVIMEIDWSVGEILKKLNELNLDDNTLVIFTTDNGPWLVYGDHGGSAMPLRGGKMTTFEGGQRVPCIMRWPGNIPAGSTCSELVTAMDILPTIASITGAELPTVQIDGKNIQQLIENRSDAKSPHEAFYYYYENNLHAIRSHQWKLHLHHTTVIPIEIGHGGLFGKVDYNKELPMALYNLDADIGEKTDLATQYPEIVQRLSQLAEEFDTDLRQNIRPVGTSEN